MNTYTKTIKETVALILAVTVVLVGMVYISPLKQAGAAMLGYTEYQDAVATTTRTTLSTNPGTASSTIMVNVKDAQAFDFNICAVASTTSGVLAYRVFYSMGDPETATASSSRTWFQETRESVSSGVVTHTRAEHTLALSTTDTCFNLAQLNVGAKWVRIDVGAQGATSTIWRSVAPKSEI